MSTYKQIKNDVTQLNVYEIDQILDDRNNREKTRKIRRIGSISRSIEE